MGNRYSETNAVNVRVLAPDGRQMEEPEHSSASGLLDSHGFGDPLSLRDGSKLTDAMPSSSLPNLMDRVRNLASATAKRLRKLMGSLIGSLPLEGLLSQVLEELVSQLVTDGNSNSGENAASG